MTGMVLIHMNGSANSAVAIKADLTEIFSRKQCIRKESHNTRSNIYGRL